MLPLIIILFRTVSTNVGPGLILAPSIKWIWLGYSGHPDCLGVQTSSRFKVESFQKAAFLQGFRALGLVSARRLRILDALVSWLKAGPYDLKGGPFEIKSRPLSLSSRRIPFIFIQAHPV